MRTRCKNGQTDPIGSEDADFQLIFTRGTSAVTSSETSSVNLKVHYAFSNEPKMNIAYVIAPKPPS